MSRRLFWSTVGFLALCAMLWAFLGREERSAGAPRGLAKAPVASPVAALRAEVAEIAEMRSVSGSERAAAFPTSPTPVTNAAEAACVVRGRVRLDGRVPEGWRVRARSEGALGLQEDVALDRDGAFTLPARTAQRLQLSFVAPEQARVLLLPRPTVIAGDANPFQFEWVTHQVNVRVHGDPGGWNHATLHLTGPDYEAEFPTNEAGRAEIALVASGRFRLEARHPNGARGSAALELADDSELESVVITLGAP